LRAHKKFGIFRLHGSTFTNTRKTVEYPTLNSLKVAFAVWRGYKSIHKTPYPYASLLKKRGVCGGNSGDISTLQSKR